RTRSRIPGAWVLIIVLLVLLLTGGSYVRRQVPSRLGLGRRGLVRGPGVGADLQGRKRTCM
ncbi:MAG TPA: hypothetical protein VEW90_01405, partial [Gaiellaceae bacterium]|nr:hypothetical protein [Gaiellaceae bacterium]